MRPYRRFERFVAEYFGGLAREAGIKNYVRNFHPSKAKGDIDFAIFGCTEEGKPCIIVLESKYKPVSPHDQTIHEQIERQRSALLQEFGDVEITFAVISQSRQQPEYQNLIWWVGLPIDFEGRRELNPEDLLDLEELWNRLKINFFPEPNSPTMYKRARELETSTEWQDREEDQREYRWNIKKENWEKNRPEKPPFGYNWGDSDS